jgi:hypothetical protein
MPRIKALRSMSPAAFRVEIAMMMMERLGHTLNSRPDRADFVTINHS